MISIHTFYNEQRSFVWSNSLADRRKPFILYDCYLQYNAHTHRQLRLFYCKRNKRQKYYILATWWSLLDLRFHCIQINDQIFISTNGV
jgi:hypothetical protein